MMSNSETSPGPQPPAHPTGETPLTLHYALGRDSAAHPKLLPVFLGLLGAIPVWFVVGFFGIGLVVGAIMSMRLGVAMIPVTVVGMLIFPALDQAGRVVRRRQVEMVIDALDQAVRMNLPLPAMVAAMQRGERGRFAIRLGRFRDLLLGGNSVGQALDAAFPPAPREVVEVLCRAEAVGQLQPALQRLTERARHRISGDPHRQPSLLGAYCLLYAGVFVGVLTLIGVVVMPRYGQILRDFHMKFPDLPWPGSLCLSLLRNTEEICDPLPLLLIAMGVFACLFVGKTLWGFIPTRSLQAPRLPGLSDWLLQCIPLVGRMRRDKSMAQVLAFMADCLDVHMPLDQAILQAQHMDLNRPLRRRLAIWGQQMGIGQPLGSAMRTSGLPSLLADMLASAELSGTLPQTMRFLADHYQSRFSRTLIVLQNASVPLVTLCFAVLTFGVWLIILSPMLKLLDAATMGWGRHP